MEYNKEELKALAAAEKESQDLFNKLKKSRSGVVPGRVFYLSDGAAEVLEYQDSNHVVIKFLETGNIVTATANNILKDRVKDKFAISVCGIGYLGNSEVRDESGKTKAAYKAWAKALDRVTNRKEYQSVTVAQDFRCFADFEIWFNELSKPFIEANLVPTIEKDLLALIRQQPKQYSLEQCFLAPSKLNLYIRHLEQQLREIDSSGSESVCTGISLEEERQLLRVSFRAADRSLKFFGYFKPQELEQAKDCLRKARLEDFKERAAQFFYLLPAHVVQSIKSM